MRYKALIEGNNFSLPGEPGRVGFFATLSINVARQEDVVEELRRAAILKVAELGLVVDRKGWVTRSSCVVKKIWETNASGAEISSGGTLFHMGARETIAAVISRVFSICIQRQFVML